MLGLLTRALRKTAAAPPAPQHLLDVPLIDIDHNDPITIGNLCEGVHIFGGIGSGKTSGSGKTLAKNMLHSGMGGLVLTAKPDELATWLEYAEATDRRDDVVVFAPDQPFRFNFLNYECTRDQAGGGQTENIVDLFMSVMDAAERGQGGGGSNADPFWQRSAKQMLRNAVDLCRLATGEVQLREIMQIINTAPRSDHDIVDSETKQTKESFDNSIVGVKLAQISDRVVRGELDVGEINDYQQTLDYWCTNFPQLADKTRSGVIATFTGMADMFLRGKLAELFCTETNLVPEDSFDPENRIIIVNLPIKQWGQVGIAAQVVFKYLWQQAIERRVVASDTLPSFLWADEAHLFVTDYDQEFLTTARSSRACMVYLSQNMPNYLAALGEQSKSRVDSLLGNFQTKIFHQNSDSVTNLYAADLIGKTIQMRRNFSSSSSDGSNSGGSDNHDGNGSSSFGNSASSSTSAGSNEQVDYDVLPIEFTRLLKGGYVNDCIVEAIVHQGGRRWKRTGKSFVCTAFDQRQ